MSSVPLLWYLFRIPGTLTAALKAFPTTLMVAEMVVSVAAAAGGGKSGLGCGTTLQGTRCPQATTMHGGLLRRVMAVRGGSSFSKLEQSEPPQQILPQLPSRQLYVLQLLLRVPMQAKLLRRRDVQE